MKLSVFTVVVVLAAATLVSCAGNNDKDYVDKSIIPTGSDTGIKQPAAASTASNTVMQPANAPVIPGATTTTMPVNITPQTTAMNVNPQNNTVITAPQTITPPQQTMTQTVQPTAPGMNPPHGQPGHRCDISVGAPLNSKPAPTAAPVATQQPQVTMKEVPNQVKTAPGMNPPHGEPGHRCDIAVGAPLNSKPAAATPVQVSTAPPALLAAPKNDSAKN